MREASEVLARKYRPSNFDELIGQETIAQTLSLALDANRLSHAYLFSGLRGSGKTSTARIFAKALICEKGVSHHPCDKCSNCIMAKENRHMDIIEMDGASSRKIDDIRDLIEQTKYKPAVARYKIFIIDEVHMLTKEAFNALLKTLEEPPEYVKFILATTDPLKLPATILSRTQHFRFKSIATNKVVDHIAHILQLEGISYETPALEILARSGNGSLRDTLTLLDQAIIYSKSYVDVNTVTDMLGLVDPQFISQLFDAVFAQDYEKLVEKTKILEDYESEMVVDELIAYLKERMFDQDPKFPILVLDKFFRILSESKYLFSINADGSFVLSMIFFKMAKALQTSDTKHREKEALPQIQTETPPQNLKKQEQQQENPKGAIALEIEEERFQQLVARIEEKNSKLGECFRNNIRYISFENSTLTWQSCADDSCKKTLKYGYADIKQFIREIFGFETKIKGLPCTEEVKKPLIQGEQSASTVEDIEIGGGASCIAGCSDPSPVDTTIQEDITKEPMVQKAIEMFEAKKVTIQSKI